MKYSVVDSGGGQWGDFDDLDEAIARALVVRLNVRTQEVFDKLNSGSHN